MNLKEIIRTIESSDSVEQASKKLGISRQTIYTQLKDNNLIIVRDFKLKVVEKV